MFILAPHLVFVLSLLGMGLGSAVPWLGLFALLPYVLGLYLVHRKGLNIGKKMETLLALPLAGASWAYAESQDLHYVFALQYWLVTILVLRGYRRMEKRDYAFCFLISASLFVHVARIYDDLPFLFLTLAYLFLAPYALFYFLAYYGGFQKADEFKPPVGIKFSLAQFRTMTGISLILTLVTAMVFVVMPRPRTGTVLGAIMEERNRVSGLSETVSLGTFNRIVEKQNIVMTVETDTPTLWRRSVLDYYESGTWYSAAKYQYRKGNELAPVDPGARLVKRRFEVFDARMSNYEFFSAGTIVSFTSLSGFSRVWINDLYSTLAMMHNQVALPLRGEYEIESLDGEYIGSGVLNDRHWLVPTDRSRKIDEKDLFLQLPPDLSQRVRTLAQSITRGLTTPEAKAEAVLRYLSRGFEYSLEGLNSEGMAPVDYFLFKSRKGHCEYFASTMAILLRCTGVRTRVVQGFAPGMLVDGKYIVRLSDAHLWTEVFYPGKGWKAYDSTPGRDSRFQLNRHAGVFEKLKLRWQSKVLRYDGVRQANLIEGMKQVVVAVIVRLKHYMKPLRYALVVGLVMFLVRRRGWWRFFNLDGLRMTGPERRVGRVRSYFGQYLKALARKGYKRGPATTPNDLVVALERDGATVLGEARLLTRFFYESRFGGAELTPAAEKEVQLAIRKIRHWAS